MGDRCYIEFECRKEDKEFFEAEGYIEGFSESDTEHLVFLMDEEGYTSTLMEMCQTTNRPVIGYAGEGCSYGSIEFACDGVKWDEFETGHDGGYVIDCDEEGKAQPDHLKRVEEFFAFRKKLREVMETAREEVHA